MTTGHQDRDTTTKGKAMNFSKAIKTGAITTLAALSLTACSTGGVEVELPEFDTDQVTQEAGDAVKSALPTDMPTLPSFGNEAPKSSTVAPADAQQALSVLDMIPVDVTPTGIDYNRKAQYTATGKSWDYDFDANGCDTRNDILARDLTNPQIDTDCTVQSGVLDDPYTGTTIEFTRGVQTSSAVQIDHIVPLSYAHHAGMAEQPKEQRVAIANDPINLVASDGPTNGSKSDKGPSEWMPSDAGNASYDCQYSIDWVTVLDSYELEIMQEDKNVLSDTLSACAA